MDDKEVLTLFSGYVGPIYDEPSLRTADKDCRVTNHGKSTFFWAKDEGLLCNSIVEYKNLADPTHEHDQQFQRDLYEAIHWCVGFRLELSRCFSPRILGPTMRLKPFRKMHALATPE